MIRQVFDAYGRYYDLLYREKDYSAEVDYVSALFERFNFSGDSLLEFGSGTGKHGCLLAKRGFEILGIERSAEMVKGAQSAPGFTCQQGDICTLALGRTFDAVLSLFHVVSYQTTNNAAHAVFSRASEHLESGGLFLFDFWYSPAVYTQRPSIRIKRFADHQVEITRLAEPINVVNENRVDVSYTILVHDRQSNVVESFQEVHPMRHFSLPEIDTLLEIHGFSRVNAEEFLTGKELNEDTWGACVVARRN